MKSGPFVSAIFLLGALAPSTGRGTAEAHPFKGGFRQRPGPPPFGPAVEARYRSSSRFLGGESPWADLRDQAAFAEPPVRDPRTPSLAVEETVERFARLHGFLPKDYEISNAYTSDHSKVTHVYLKQIINGRPVVNADMNLNIDRQGRVFSYGDSFFRGRKPDPVGTAVRSGYGGLPPANGGSFGALERRFAQFQQLFAPASEPSAFSSDAGGQGLLSPKDALLMLSRHLNVEIRNADDIQISFRASQTSDEPAQVLTNVPFTLNGEAPNRMTYIQTGDGKLELVHEFELEMQENWYSAHVSAVTGKVISLVDWTADAGYTVFPLGYNDPRDGPRVHVLDPADDVASPFGWHSHGDDKNFTTTVGNNVYAHENLDGSYGWENNHRPDGSKALIFNNTLDLTEQPKESIDAAITNLFYWNNVIHDLFYRYGFDEKAGNFQENNLERGGKEGDAVIANAQDGSGFNNANFATPPDGQRGKMRMYVWNVVTPYRDGDLESGIIIHEYAHGISTRLTGGPANSNCLGWGEAGGMGEGWGDFFATVLRMKPSTTREESWMMGDYCNGGEGIRKYPYSSDKKTNPETFGVMDKPGYWGVHAKGAVWAQMLFEVYWNLVEKHGFTEDWYSASPKFGNTLMLQLVVDGMKLQPCRPTFIQARDAILEADKVLTGGENKCEIWAGFAKRGLGHNAKVEGSTPWGGGVRKESFKPPATCKS